MKKSFFLGLAWQNLKNNHRFYIPRILTEIGLLACFYITLTLSLDKRLSQIKGGDYIPILMALGTIIVGILSIILMLYVNSFLMKQRKREFGLYNVLGMEKKHIGKVLLHESFLSSVLSWICGIAFGILFYKICSLCICKLLESEVVFGFYFIRPLTIIISAGIFIVIDVITYVANRISVARLKPVDMLSSTKTGEKEPKIKWALFVIGILLVAAGYYVALTTVNPFTAIINFFIVAGLVICGTYFLFVSGTIFVLKCLKKNKKYYYTKKHMPSVSGLLYRMKQNAVGLASICILTTGVLVMISTTVSMYSGMDKTLQREYMQDMYLNAGWTENNEDYNEIPIDVLHNITKEAGEKFGLKVETSEEQKYLVVSYLYMDDILYWDQNEVGNAWDQMYVANFMFISEDEYVRLTGERLNLSEDEIAICKITGSLDTSQYEITIQDKKYKVKEILNRFPITNSMVSAANGFGIIVSESELGRIYEAQKKSYGIYASEYTHRIAVCFDDKEKMMEAGTEIGDEIFDRMNAYVAKTSKGKGKLGAYLDSVWDAKEAMMGMYGSLLFLGIILGIVFIFATALIIFYKQISEGYEDRYNFQIMQKIGMSQTEVKKTINHQIVLVFLLPIIVAGVHFIFVSSLLQKMMRALVFYNNWLFIICSVIVYAAFVLVYVLIYKGTAKTYYKIVR